MLFDSPPREFPGSDVEVIFTPGHADNSVCYRSPYGKTYLLTGASIYLDNGEWKTIVVTDNGDDQAELADSLPILRDLKVGVVICSASIDEMEIVEATRDK